MRFAIVGTNFVSDTFIESAALVEGCEVVAVLGRDFSKTLKFKEKYGIANAFESLSDLLEWGDFDAVYIATPNSTHKDISIQFMKAKKHVFCEKPLAANYDEALFMINTAKENMVYLQEGLFPLFSENYRIIKENLSKVGKIRQVYINMSQYSSRYDAYLRGENPTTFRRELCNGAAMDLGVYTLALALGLFGEPKSLVSDAVLLESGVDASCSAILKYDGFLVNLSASKVCDTENRFEISGEEGILSINHPTKIESIVFKPRNGGESVELAAAKRPNFYPEILEMLDSVKSGALEGGSVPHSFSLTLHKYLSLMRKFAGIIFPNDSVPKC